MWKKSRTRTAPRRGYAFETNLTPGVNHASSSLRVVPAIADSDQDTYADPLKTPFTSEQVPAANDSGYTWEQWLETCKIEAGRANPTFAVNANGGSMVDFMDQAPLREAYRKDMCPRTMGQIFGAQYYFESI